MKYDSLVFNEDLQATRADLSDDDQVTFDYLAYGPCDEGWEDTLARTIAESTEFRRECWSRKYSTKHEGSETIREIIDNNQ